MADIKSNYGYLINKDIKLHRMWFKQMIKQYGINCTYHAPREDKEFNIKGELGNRPVNRYYEPIEVGCIFQEHPDQKTMKKMGWVAELQEGSSIIHVPYDLEHLQVGAIFDIPPGIEGAPMRSFRVISMQNIMIYPASIACEIALEYETKEEDSSTRDFTQDNFTILRDNEEDD